MQEIKLHLHSDRERRTSDDILRSQLVFIADRGIASTRGRGWDYEIGTISCVPRESESGRWRFTSTIRFYRKVDVDPSRFQRQSSEILEFASAAGFNAKFQNRPWVCVSQADVGKPQSEMALLNLDNDDDSNSSSDDPAHEQEIYVPMREVGEFKKGKYFDHLYGLDSQITVLMSALQAASDSDMKNRFHSLMWGFAGCGKTEILQSTSKLLTHLGVSHQLLDATSTTEAGMRKSLLDEDKLVPEVFLIEEIEKTPENSLRWLLGIMDIRGVIQQANYRKTASRKVDAIVLATANDMNLLKRMMYGALHSRFQHEIYCPRPDRLVLAKILEREVNKVSGDHDWIEPTLSFMYDECRVTDPRKIIPVCLCGKEKLLTGEYQQHKRKTMMTMDDAGNLSAGSHGSSGSSVTPSPADLVKMLEG